MWIMWITLWRIIICNRFGRREYSKIEGFLVFWRFGVG